MKSETTGDKKMTKIVPFKILLALCVLAVLTSNVQADLNLTDATATGQWFNPARDGEGFFVEIVGEGDNLQIAVSMYSFDESGNQLWLAGSVAISDGDIGATVPVILVDGPTWGTQGFDPADRNITEFGSISVRFPTCDSALFSVQSNVAGLESGSYSLVRLTEIAGMDCTDPPPPPVEGQITAGLWEGEGVCFFVNAEGTKLVESDLCDNGNAFSADRPGFEGDFNGKLDGDACVVDVACDTAWGIKFGDFIEAHCINDLGGIGRIVFDTENSARVWAFQLFEVGSKICGTTQSTTATPVQ
jgi:hypothetical protein